MWGLEGLENLVRDPLSILFFGACALAIASSLLGMSWLLGWWFGRVVYWVHKRSPGASGSNWGGRETRMKEKIAVRTNAWFFTLLATAVYLVMAIIDGNPFAGPSAEFFKIAGIALISGNLGLAGTMVTPEKKEPEPVEPEKQPVPGYAFLEMAAVAKSR